MSAQFVQFISQHSLSWQTLQGSGEQGIDIAKCSLFYYAYEYKCNENMLQFTHLHLSKQIIHQWIFYRVRLLQIKKTESLILADLEIIELYMCINVVLPRHFEF